MAQIVRLLFAASLGIMSGLYIYKPCFDGKHEPRHEQDKAQDLQTTSNN